MTNKCKINRVTIKGWVNLDNNIAQSQLCDFGFIIVGEDGAPIDNELDIECIIETETL